MTFFAANSAEPQPVLADERTLAALDFTRVRERVVSATRTQRGRSRAAALAPSADYGAVRALQARTGATRELVAGADLHVLPAVETADLTQAAVLGRTLAPGELRAVGEALTAAAAAFRAVRESAELAEVVAPFVPLRELSNAITDAIDERAAVVDRASPALGRIRRNLVQAQAQARDRVAGILKSSKYANAIQDSVVTIREGRFVIPVKAEFAAAVPGIVHDTSSSGQTLFVEPLPALETNNRVRTLRLEEAREVQRILEELSRRVGAAAAAIDADVEVLAAVDLLVAKAEVARGMDATAPLLTDEALVSIERGRHPLLGERAVPQSVALGDATRFLIVSGPNMGGKSVALKMVGLLVTMTYCGLHIPAAAGSTIGRFESVVADVGDEQSIAANASTFSAHLQRMREMLERAGPRMLVLIDEIGGGTEPGAGAALAIAILERLLASGARGIVTTHATELKLFAHANPGFANASVRFDPHTFKPTFELDAGAPGQSLAFPLARAMAIDSEIVERAEHLLGARERDYEAALAELSQRNAELHAQHGRLLERTAEVSRERIALERERDAFEAQRRAFGERAEERMREALREFVRELQQRATDQRKPRVTPAQSGLLERTVEAMHRDLGIEPATPPVAEAVSFEPGDAVDVISLHQNGSILEDYGETVLIAVGPMRTVVAKRDLRRRPGAAGHGRGAAGGASVRMEAATRTLAELDVRGKRFAEAEPLVERWIDDAVLAGLSSLRLIHGKGTGMLGRGLQEYLRLHDAVRSVRYGNEDEGSAGVTVVELR
jgi:DNA mismatch repair protein MutS2